MNQDFQTQYKLAPDNYLARNYIMEYLNDSVQQLLDIRNSNPKIDILEFFGEYFKSVKQGTHILFREYSFIASTPHNRGCFIEKILETYTSMLEKEEPLKTCDFHALILLLCPDFPLEIVEKSLRMICPIDNLSAFFKDFIYAFQFQFYYKEFAKQSKQIYDNDHAIKMDESASSSLQSTTKLLSCGMNKKKFLDHLEILSSQVNYSFPSKIVLKEVLKQKDGEVNYDDFTLELSKNDKLTVEIGKLPTKAHITDYRNKKKDIKPSEPEEKPDPPKFIPVKPKKSSPPPQNKYPSDDSRTTSTDSSTDSDV